MISSDIIILPEKTVNGVRWAASATKNHPETINIHEHPFWSIGTDEQIATKMYRLFSHETIHHLLWEFISDESGSQYDTGRSRFLSIIPDDDDCYSCI